MPDYNHGPEKNHETSNRRHERATLPALISRPPGGRLLGVEKRGRGNPELKKGCLSGQCVAGQFETAYQRFALITGDMVNLRTRPDTTSRVLAKMPVTRKVTVLYVKPDEVTIGAMKGRWAYVRDTARPGP